MWVRHFHGIYHADKEQLPCTEAQDVAEVTETLVSSTLLITAFSVIWFCGPGEENCQAPGQHTPWPPTLTHLGSFSVFQNSNQELALPKIQGDLEDNITSRERGSTSLSVHNHAASHTLF